MKTSYLMLLFFILIAQTFSLKYSAIQKKRDIDEGEIEEFMEILCTESLEDCETNIEVIYRLLGGKPSSGLECQYIEEKDVYCSLPTE